MKQAAFKHYDLTMIEPSFGAKITDLIIELDYLRKKELAGSTRPSVFFQLKNIFHILESIGSARIEGNNTTIAEYFETKIEGEEADLPVGIKEIKNIEDTMTFIEENVVDYPINRAFIAEVHKGIVSGLAPPPNGEGDSTPGEYRKHNVAINKSTHIPPEWIRVDDYMNELINFIGQERNSKYDLLNVAIAHHRFVWIHPFGNGNGRTVRLFTYSMLVKLGFNIATGRILNPTAVFCSNRDDYYKYLSIADKGTKDGILRWCEYVLNGLKNEIEKIDRLLDYSYLKDNILLPTLKYSLDRQHITELEFRMLRRVINSEKQSIQSGDIKDLFPGKQKSEISRQIRRLIKKNMLMPEIEGARKYVIRFDNNYMLRGIISSLDEKGFLPIRDESI